MMFRLKIGMVVLGVMLAYFGVQEYRVSMGTSLEPALVDLEAIEKGETPDNNHWLVGEHMADYPGCVYEYEEDSKKITHMYYPIISEGNIYFDKLNEVIGRHGGMDNVPDGQWPAIDQFRVLVKTKRFKKENEIPDRLSLEDTLQGLVINLIGSMDSEEEEMIQSQFPLVNMDDVLIIQDGRHPSSAVKSLGMIGGGSIVTLLGFAWMFLGRLSSSAQRRA